LINKKIALHFGRVFSQTHLVIMALTQKYYFKNKRFFKLKVLREEGRVEAGQEDDEDEDGAELVVLGRLRRLHLEPDQRVDQGRKRQQDQDGAVLRDQVVGVKRSESRIKRLFKT
jgi:hypothetical protein